MWSGAVAIIVYHNQDYIPFEAAWTDVLIGMLYYLGAAMLLHGLYDTLLKQGHNAIAFLIALVSVGWLSFMFERSRNAE